MRKEDVATRQGYPALNVKVHNFWPTQAAIQARFNCPEEIADRALEYAFESTAELFWNESAPEIARECFSHFPVEVWQDGRSGGWLYVEGLPDVSSWDAIMLGRWARFARMIREDIRDRAGPEGVMEDIEANRWAEEGAERYNFFDHKGKVVALPDIKRAEREGRESFLSQN